jgi:adenylate kinase family enzyme
VSGERSPILFLLGPSGSGKTRLGGWLAEDLQMLHLEIDRWPGGDGIDLEGLRTEWNAFLGAGQATSLATAIRGRTRQAGAHAAVLSFPSSLVLAGTSIRAAEEHGIQSLVLYGSAAECLRAFLARERATGRRLDQDHWMQNNAGPYIAYSQEEFAPYRLDAFTGGAHRTRADLVEDVRRRMPANQPLHPPRFARG